MAHTETGQLYLWGEGSVYITNVIGEGKGDRGMRTRVYGDEVGVCAPRRRQHVSLAVTNSLALPKRSLGLRAAGAASSCPCPWVDSEVLTRQRVSVLAVRLAAVSQGFGVADDLQMIRVPTGVDAATVMQLHAVWDRTA